MTKFGTMLSRFRFKRPILLLLLTGRIVGRSERVSMLTQMMLPRTGNVIETGWTVVVASVAVQVARLRLRIQRRRRRIDGRVRCGCVAMVSSDDIAPAAAPTTTTSSSPSSWIAV